MPRPRNAARVVHFDSDRTLPPALVELFATGDPALDAITAAVLDRREAGDDVTDSVVLNECIAAGRRAHAQPAGPEEAPRARV